MQGGWEYRIQETIISHQYKQLHRGLRLVRYRYRRLRMRRSQKYDKK